MPGKPPQGHRGPGSSDRGWFLGSLLRCGQVAGALVAIGALVTLWPKIGLPVPAWSQDVERLESQQLDTAAEVYQQKRDDLTVLGAKLKATGEATETEQSLVEKELQRAQKALDRIEQRRIELSR
jgi:hypothetical protein